MMDDISKDLLYTIAADENEEKIVIRPINSEVIELHGAEWVEFLINQLIDQSRLLWKTSRSDFLAALSDVRCEDTDDRPYELPILSDDDMQG